MQGGAGLQIYMTPQDDKTADVLSNALGRSTITAVTESQSRVRALDDSANVSRRSEERPLVSANELLRFPLDEVIILPEGQYPIRAQHIRYYEDRHFGLIERARKGHALPYPVGATKAAEAPPAKLSGFQRDSQTMPDTESVGAERANGIAICFAEIGAKAAKARRLPKRLMPEV